MTRLGAEAWLAAAVIWLSVMLPSSAFGGFDGAAAHPAAAAGLVLPR